MDILQHDPARRTGRTTRLCLKLINEAIENAGEYVVIQDHTNLRQENVRLCSMIRTILDVLNIQHSWKILGECRIMVHPK